MENQSPTLAAAFPVVIPSEFVILERSVRADFLGPDLTKICRAAGQSGSTLLISAAGQPLKQREVAFELWHKERLAELAGFSGELKERFAEDPTGRDEYEAGTIDFMVLDGMLATWRAKNGTRRVDRNHVKNCQKRALKLAVDMNTEDALLGRIPHFCVIRADGQSRLFRSRVPAKLWAMAGKAGYHLIPLDLKNITSRYSDGAAQFSV